MRKLDKKQDLENKISANQRLLRLYDSPFPDPQELAHRAKIVKEIKELEMELYTFIRRTR